MRRVRDGLLTLALGAALLGCGDGNLFGGLSDDSSDQGRLERGVEAINEGDWDTAIALLEGLDLGDPEVRKYLASAYVGRAGFDTLELVDRIVTAQDAGSSGSVLYGAAVELFGDADGDGRISSDDLRAKEADVNRAVELLAAGGGAPAPEDSFQAGLYASLHAVILVADVIDQPDVSLNAVAGLEDAAVDAAVTDESFDGVQGALERDLELVSAAVESFGDNDVGQDFDAFLTSMGFDDGAVGADDVRAFVKGLGGSP